MNHLLSAVLACACALAATLPIETALGQRSTSPRFPRGFPFSDPDKFFEQLFGRETEENREALAKVRISLREEAQIGLRAVNSYLENVQRQGARVTTRGHEVEYLQSLIAVLRPHMRNKDRYRRLRVYFVNSTLTDARSFPGGHLVFFRGMLDFTESEAALVGVIGHELSHLDHGHQLDGVRRMKLARQTFTSGAGSSEQFFRSGTMMMRMFMRPFRPEDEAQADQDGATWAYRKGYDPREMAALFRRLHMRDGSGPATAPSFLRTHPYHIDRHRAVLDRYTELQAAEPATRLYIGRQNLVRRIPRSARVFPE